MRNLRATSVDVEAAYPTRSKQVGASFALFSQHQPISAGFRLLFGSLAPYHSSRWTPSNYTSSSTVRNQDRTAREKRQHAIKVFILLDSGREF